MAGEAKTRTVKKDTRSLGLTALRQPRVLQWLRRVPTDVVLVFVLCGSIALLFPYASSVHSFGMFREGEAATETVIAPFTFDIPKSGAELEREQMDAVDRVLLVVDYDGEVRRRVGSRLRSLRRTFEQLADRKAPDTARAALRRQLGRDFSETTVNTLRDRPALFEVALARADRALGKGVMADLLVSSSQELTEMRSRYNLPFPAFRMYGKPFVLMRREQNETTVSTGDLPVKEIAIEGIIQALEAEGKYDPASLNGIYELLQVSLEPNCAVNDRLTSANQQAASASVLPIKGKVIKDTEIVRKHQEVTPAVMEKLRALQQALASMHGADERWRTVSGNLGRVATAIVPLLFFAVYVRRYHAGAIRDPRHAGALVAVVVLQVALVRLGLAVAPRLMGGGAEPSELIVEYLIPVTTGAMLGTILFRPEIGYLVALYSALFFGIVLGFKLNLALFAFLGGVMAAYAIRNVRYRWDYLKAIPAIVGVYVIMVWLWHASLGRAGSLAGLGQNMGLAAINAVLSTFVAMMVTAVFEYLFEVTTNMTLVELSDMNSPVLKRLSIEAPGTYNHSVLVANLAESAAERIDANALLARVASYYHDIGKLEKTDYFVENMTATDRSKHNKLAPSMSALIISSHVKEGVELARRYRLPRVIRDSILQHHGNSTVSFFYEKALEQDPHKQVQEDDFRYPGPRPQTRENAVIMLADSVEAASRSLATSSPRLLRELVKKIIRDKFLSSQLDQSDLTLRDLDEIVEGFMPILQGIFHTRIEYPST